MTILDMDSNPQDQTYAQLIQRVVDLLEKSQNYRVLILIIGQPGSGKTTVSKKIESLLNKKFQQDGIINNNDIAQTDNNINHFSEIFKDTIGKLRTYDSSNPIDIPPDKDTFESMIEYQDDSINILGRGLHDTQIEISTKSPPKSQRNYEFAKRISMDGFHLPVSVLQQFPDPEHAIEKRGSPATFDAGQVVKLIELLKDTCLIKSPITTSHDQQKNKNPFWINTSLSIPTITTPDFSHELKDPSPGGTTIQPETRVVIMEGLYLLLKDSKPWCGIPELIINNNDKLVCEVWKINVPQSIARSRVSQRHLDSGLVTSLQKGVQRYDENDLPNGILVDEASCEKLINLTVDNY